MRWFRPPFLLALLVAPMLAGVPLQAQEGTSPSLLVLIRHAERAGPSADNPGLTPVGAERARELARLVGEVGITRIHSSDTRRTRETVAPLAGALGIEVESYDPRRLGDLALMLREAPGVHLVVGHSNTTDELSELLGGASFGPIVEDWEYDRLYFLTPHPGGGIATVMIRYGPPVARGYPPTP